MAINKQIQFLRNTNKIYTSRTEAVNAIETLVNGASTKGKILDGQPILARYKDTDGKVKTVTASVYKASNGATQVTYYDEHVDEVYVGSGTPPSTAKLAIDPTEDIMSIVQTTGTSTTSVMSQNAVTDALSTKVGKTDITQSTGTSETAVMSQKAVSDIVDELEWKVTNAADGEDITVIEENDRQKLKFADRNYNHQVFSGKGYKILRKNIQTINGVRKNILVQDMINEPNTIYEIRYDFDLNGAEITVPENCVLKFNGGSLSNGTINGNLYNIDAQKYKIFENINIKGAAKLNNYYLIDWWVKTPQYEFIKENNPIDNYEDIQSAFNSGAENFIFSSDRYYYIKKTLLINGEINLFSDVEHKHFDGNDRAHKKEPPCLYSNEIVTLIEYKYKSNTHKGSIYIGSINLVCNKPFSNLSEKDTPILYIHGDASTVNTGVWGVVIKCNIKAKDLVIDLKNEYPDIYEQSVNIYAPNYTGLMIKGDYVNFSYIKICSYICMTYYGIIIPKTENNHWITDVTIEGDTRCVIGGKFIGGGNPVRIFGSHQPENALAKTDKVRNIGYFSGEYIQLYGFIWDINQTTFPERGNCPMYPVEILNTAGDYNNPLIGNTILSPAIRFIKNADLNFRNFSIKALFSDNLLNYVGNPLLANIIKNFSLKLDNKDYTEYPQIYNTRYLFGIYPWIIDVYYMTRHVKNNAYIITQSDEEIPYKLHFELNSVGYTDKKELIIKCDSNSVYIRVQTNDGNTIIDGTYDLTSSFYLNSYFSILLPTKDVLVDIEFKIKKPKGVLVYLPLIKVPSTNNNVFNNKTNISDIKGDFIYDTTSNKAGWWNGEYWADINGYNIDYNVKGTTAERPTLKSTDDGFEYYDTTLKKKIIWNGTEWTNSDNHYTKSEADNKFATKESTDTKVAKTDIVQSVGNATDKIMSQKAVSDALNTKVNKTDIVQSTGTSTTAVMSQKAVTDSFAANTPSGDPMHNMYVAMGAVWNGSGVDKTYPTPWADYAEDEEDKVCVHKSGHWKFYDVGDLTNFDMIYAYRDYGLNIKFTNLQFINSQSRIISLGWHIDAKSLINDGYEPFAICNNLIEIVFYKNSLGIVTTQGTSAYMFAFNKNMKYVYGKLNFTESIHNTAFMNCLDLRIVFVTNLQSRISFKDSPKLSKHCVRYMIENATDATVTITLHPEAYERAIADTGVQTALANKTNVSLAKGE